MAERTATRATLEAHLEELSSRRERIAAHGREGVPADFAEQATARENDEVVSALGQQVEAEIALVRAALERLDRGEYGRCSGCGEAIAPARLEALPWAARCAACAD